MSHRTLPRPALIAMLTMVSIMSIAPRGVAGETTELQELLAREIIGPELALEEVRAFTEARVPRMPAVASREEWERRAAEIRENVLKHVVYRGETAQAWRDAELKWEQLDTIAGGPGYSIRKLRYEALPGLWIPALLYVPEENEGVAAGPRAAALNVNGHDGAGKAAPYKQLRCINMVKRGMVVLNVEWLGMGQLRGEGYVHYRMNQLDLCGVSGLAPFYLAMKRGLDVLEAQDNIDRDRIVVSGLSGGGWQTIFISSLDTRVDLANPVAGYSSFLTRAGNLPDLGDSEQTPNDLAGFADYNHLTALMAPRPLLLTYNKKDECCFASDHALPPLLKAAEPIYKLYGQEDRLRSHINHDPGTHNFLQDNREALYRMLGDHFFTGDRDFPRTEIDSETEVKTAEELMVELPEHNETFHSLAAARLEKLPLDAGLPADRSGVKAWQTKRRALLGEILRYDGTYTVKAREVGKAKIDSVEATYWKLHIGESWTVPAVELHSTDLKPIGTTIVVADAGRASVEKEVAELLKAGQRVVAIDPFYFGESKIAQKDFLYALLVAAVAERSLGLQTSQVAAAARWLADDRRFGPVTVAAHGPRASLFALTAGAMEPKAIAGVQLHGSLGSLKEIVEQNKPVNEAPEQFCFGLLERFDIVQIAALVAPRTVEFHERTERVNSEMANLEAWTKLLDGNSK